MRYDISQQIERTGERTYILEREDGTKTSPLTGREAFAIIHFEESADEYHALLAEISDFPDSSIQFGEEIKKKINEVINKCNPTEDKILPKLMEMLNDG